MATSPSNPYDQFDANPYDQFDNARYGTGQSLDVTDAGLVPSGSPEAQAAYSPTAGNNFLQNARIGIGKLYTDVALGARQIGAQVTGADPSAVVDPITNQNAADKRETDVAINHTWGGRVGEFAGALPLAFIPGANTYAGAAAIGGGLAALQPTTGNESRLLNTGIGAGVGIAAKFAGDSFSNWLRARATQPFMGWTPANADATLAQAVGSQAPNLGGGELGVQADRLGQVFQAGRSAATNIDLTATPPALDQMLSGLNPSVRQIVESNPNVADLISHATASTPSNGRLLGNISTGLRQDAYSALNAEGGNREVGLALQQIRAHIEDLIQTNIADPGLRAAYTAARPQYGLLQDVRYNPSVLNASTGRANMEAFGKFLQRNNPAYTAPGASENELFNAALWGQSGGGAKGVPSFSLGTPWKLPIYGLTHNPVSRALGGATSRVLAPRVARYGLAALGVDAEPQLVTDLEQ